MSQEPSEAARNKPSIKEIAAMPYPASVRAMREHYNPAWGKAVPEGAVAPRKFKVEVSYTYRGSDVSTIEVEAWSEDEAKDLAAEKIDDIADLSWDADIEVDECRIIAEQSQ